MKIFGPLIGFIEFFKNINFFINILNRKKTTYYEEILVCNNLYQKQITILGSDPNKACNIFKIFKHKLT